jgi:hypothetical protein
VNRLEELRRVFGGTIRALGERRWLDTRIGGLRTFVVQRGRAATVTLDLAVFMPDTRELDPFHARVDTSEWVLGPDQALPSLSHGFVFAGCRGGVLFAKSVRQPSLEDIVATLWELGRWAREPWQPREGTRYRAAWRRMSREQLLRLCVVVLLVVVLWWLRGEAT